MLHAERNEWRDRKRKEKGMSESLPMYESKATPEEHKKNSDFMRYQQSMIAEQNEWEMRVSFVSVRCVCDKKLKIIEGYRCLYCGIYYCKDCAEIHFGYKAAEVSGEKKRLVAGKGYE